MAVMWRAFVLVVFLVCLHASTKADAILAEVWVCPGPGGTEALTDQGGPGCRQRDNSRPAVTQPSNSTQGVQQRPLDVGSRFQLALIDYEQVHKVLIERCSRSYPDSVPALQAAIGDWQRMNREALRELRDLWRNGLSAFRGGALDGEKQAGVIPNMMTTNMKDQMVKLGEGDFKQACYGGFAATLRNPALDFVSLREQLRGKEETYMALMRSLAAKANSSNGEQSLTGARQCASAGNVNCMIQTVELLLSADKTAANLQEAREWARKALSKGDQRSGFYLANAYLADPNNRFIVDGKADHAKYETLAKRTITQRTEQIEALEALAGSAQTGFVPAKLLLATLLYEQSGGAPAERVAQLLKDVAELPPIYQTLKKNTEVVLALGPSHASPKLVTDAMMTALMGAAGQAQRKDIGTCKDVKPVKISNVTPLQDVDWLPLKHPLIANSYPLKGHWTEDWTVMLCSSSYTVHMQFQADGLGGAYHMTQAQPAPLRNVSSLSPDVSAAASEPAPYVPHDPIQFPLDCHETLDCHP